MKKKNGYVFAVDVDEVIRQLLPTMVRIYNKDFKDNIAVEDIKYFDVDKSFPKVREVSGRSAVAYFFEDNAEALFSNSSDIEGAVDAISRLRKYGRVIIVTFQRDFDNRMRTLGWLEKHGVVYDGLCFLEDKTLVHADYFIDDNPSNFNGCNCKNGVLISAPYNTDVNVHDLLSVSNSGTIIRSSSIAEFVNMFENYVNGVE